MEAETAVALVAETPEAEAGVREGVLRGVAWLDEVHPNWRTRINWDRFDVNDGSNCILGQLYGFWEEMMFADWWLTRGVLHYGETDSRSGYGATWDQFQAFAQEHGFHGGYGGEEVALRWRLLGEEWLAVAGVYAII